MASDNPQDSELRNRAARGMRATLVTVVISLLLAIVKVAAGLLGHSYALIADGVESMLDLVGALVVWGGFRIASRPPDHSHPYGHGKAESMAAMTVALLLLGAAVGIAVQSVRELLEPRYAPAPFTLLVLLVVVLTKELIFRRLSRIGREISSTSLQVDAWHHRSDALTSVAAFIGISIALIGGPGFESADAWAALAACLVIAFNGIRLLSTAVAEMMDAAPPVEVVDAIRAAAAAIPGVEVVEKCFARKSGPGWLVDIHVQVAGTLTVDEGHAIGHRVKDALCLSDLDVIDVMVHLEPAEGETRPSDTHDALTP